MYDLKGSKKLLWPGGFEAKAKVKDFKICPRERPRGRYLWFTCLKLKCLKLGGCSTRRSQKVSSQPSVVN